MTDFLRPVQPRLLVWLGAESFPPAAGELQVVHALLFLRHFLPVKPALFNYTTPRHYKRGSSGLVNCRLVEFCLLLQGLSSSTLLTTVVENNAFLPCTMSRWHKFTDPKMDVAGWFQRPKP